MAYDAHLKQLDKELSEICAILEALSRYFDSIVYLDNKFKQQWEEATQPPCLHLNLRLKRETLPAELLALLPETKEEESEQGEEAEEKTKKKNKQGSSWIVELQLSMLDFLDVKKRCHAIYEIMRLRVEGEVEVEEGEEVAGEGGNGQNEAIIISAAQQGKKTKKVKKKVKKMLGLPRACPVCGLLQHYVKSSQLTPLKDVSFSQKLVKKCLLLEDNEKREDQDNEARGQHRRREVAYSIIAINKRSCVLLEPTFVREVGLLTRLDHPNVLQITGVVREADTLGFVTPWMPSGTLWNWLQGEEEEGRRRRAAAATTILTFFAPWTCGISRSSCVTPFTMCTVMEWCTLT